jgi:hypothetical protein
MQADNLNFKRVIRKYEFLTEELKDVKEIQSKLISSFEEALREKGYSPEPIIQSGHTENSKSTESLLHGKYKKLFRKVVVLVHPDKIDTNLSEVEKNKYKGFYEDAIKSNITGDITPLLFVAIKLNIDIVEYMGDIESIVNSCNNLEGEIKKIQSSSCWHYNNLKNDEEKQHFLNKFIEYINK